MKCKYCNATWELPAGSKFVVEKCPFCDKKIIEEVIEKINSVDAVLKKFYQEEGIEFFKDALRVYNLLVDLCPEHKVERTRIRTALLWGLPEKINKIVKDNSDDIDIKISKLRREFLEGCEVIDVVFDYSVKSILYALGIEMDEEFFKFNTDQVRNNKNSDKREIKIEKRSQELDIYSSNMEGDVQDSINKDLFRKKDVYIQLLIREFLINGRKISDDEIKKVIIINKLDFAYGLTVEDVKEDLGKISTEVKKQIEQQQILEITRKNKTKFYLELRQDYGLDPSNWCAIGQDFMAILNRKGEVKPISYKTSIYSDASKWNNIVSIVAGDNNLFGLTNIGTVCYVGLPVKNIDKVKSWVGVKSLAFCNNELFGLCADGTIVSTSDLYKETICKLKNVVKIYALNKVFIAILEKGQVVSNMVWINKLKWSDVKEIVIEENGIIGLTDDTIMYARENHSTRKYNINNVVAISGYNKIFLTNSNGKVYYFVPQNDMYSKIHPVDWDSIKNYYILKRYKIISVCSGKYTTAFLSAGGEVILSNLGNPYELEKVFDVRPVF